MNFYPKRFQGGGLFDLEARDADLSIEADVGILLGPHAVGEVDHRAVR